MIDLSQLNESHIDFFTEIENIGASHAATALSGLLGRLVRLRVPSVAFYEFNSISDKLGGPENLVVGLLVEMTGELTGFVLLVQDANDARALSDSIVSNMGIPKEKTEDLLSEMQISVLQELANILSGAYVSAISNLTNLNVTRSVPKMVVDMAGAIMNLPAAIYGEYGDVVLFMETQFIDANTQEEVFNGHFLLVPDARSFAALLKTMGME